MKNFNLILVLVWFLLFSVLIVENIAIPMSVLVFVSYEKVYWLVFFSTLIWMMLGWWIKWLLSWKWTGWYDSDIDEWEWF